MLDDDAGRIAEGPPPDAPARCLNCGAALRGRFCAACGQEERSSNPTLKELAGEVVSESFSIDGRLFRSILKLLFAPGFLTREYFAGRRQPWVSPFRLYLTFSAVYFGLAVLTGPDPSRVRDAQRDADVRQFGFRTEGELETYMRDVMNVWIPRLMFVLVPACAGLVYVSLRRTGHNYPHHVAFALHVHSVAFAAGAVAKAAARLPSPLLVTAIERVVGAYALIYAVLALRRVYDLSILRAIVQAFVIMGVYYVIIVLAVLAVILPALYRHAP